MSVYHLVQKDPKVYCCMAISWQDSVPFFTLISVAEPAVAAAVAKHSGINSFDFFELCIFTVLNKMMRLEIFNERLARH